MRKVHALDTLEAAQAHKQWELSKYTTKELEDELTCRVQDVANIVANMKVDYGKYITKQCMLDIPEQHDVCKHNLEMGYCPVDGCVGSY